MKRYFYILILIFNATFACSQVKVDAILDTTTILIGEQTYWKVNVTAPKGSKIEFPKYKNFKFVPDGIEIVQYKIDTLSTETNDSYSENITLTGWTPKSYKLPSMFVQVNGKEYKSKELTINVKDVETDTSANAQVRPADDIQNNPFSISDWMLYFWLSILVILLLIVAYFLKLRLLSEKPIIRHKHKSKIQLPHEKALDAISNVNMEFEINDSEQQKAFYTRLINILRDYLEDRFNIKAMEMTSAEILQSLKDKRNESQINELRNLLETVDLVKFAKYSTDNSDRDNYLQNVINFIEETKSAEVPIKEELENIDVSDRRFTRQRRMLKLVILGILILVSILIVIITWGVYTILD